MTFTPTQHSPVLKYQVRNVGLRPLLMLTQIRSFKQNSIRSKFMDPQRLLPFLLRREILLKFYILNFSVNSGRHLDNTYTTASSSTETTDAGLDNLREHLSQPLYPHQYSYSAHRQQSHRSANSSSCPIYLCRICRSGCPRYRRPSTRACREAVERA